MRYELSKDDEKRLRDWHFSAPDADQPERFEAINNATRTVAKLVMEACPPTRQRSLALTALEETRMWANSAIAQENKGL